MDSLNKQYNNFDLLRLFACLQVVVSHSFSFYNVIPKLEVLKYFNYFPGVIIFFGISGFLILKSSESSSDKNFIKKRFLRIYPGLFVNFIITLIILSLFGYVYLNKDLVYYSLAQLSICQFYVPQSIKSFALGHPNGALWTISIEIQFYILVYLLSSILNWNKKSLLFKNSITLFLIFSAIIINRYSNISFDQESLIFKLIFNSVFYHFQFFGVGMLLWINFSKVERYLKSKFFIWFSILILFISLLSIYKYQFSRHTFDYLSFLFEVVLIITLFSFAFSFKKLSYNILKNNDISYGVYIYHCLVLSTFIELNIDFKYIGYYYPIAIVLGALSWYLVEKRILKFKPS